MSACPFDEPDCAGQDHSICDRGEGACQTIGADFIQHTLGEMAAEAEAALLESLAIHAPPCPEWWQSGSVHPDRAWTFDLEDARMRRIARWPWVYAAAVLAARPGGAK